MGSVVKVPCILRRSCLLEVPEVSASYRPVLDTRICKEYEHIYSRESLAHGSLHTELKSNVHHLVTLNNRSFPLSVSTIESRRSPPKVTTPKIHCQSKWQPIPHSFRQVNFSTLVPPTSNPALGSPRKTSGRPPLTTTPSNHNTRLRLELGQHGLNPITKLNLKSQPPLNEAGLRN